jgi:mono/diheme cytochrome c family protein
MRGLQCRVPQAVTVRDLKRRILLLHLSVTLVLLAGATAPFAQDIGHGQRLAERWCTECHAIGSVPAKRNRAPAFAAIAAKPNISSDVIAAFLLLPHATMPNPPLSRKDAEDIAAFMMEMKK